MSKISPKYCLNIYKKQIVAIDVYRICNICIIIKFNELVCRLQIIYISNIFAIFIETFLKLHLICWTMTKSSNNYSVIKKHIIYLGND